MDAHEKGEDHPMRGAFLGYGLGLDISFRIVVNKHKGDIRVESGRRIARLEQEVPQGAQGSVFDVVAEGLGDAGALLARYHHLIHEADIEDDRYDAPEAPGLDVVLRGLSLIGDDEQVIVVDPAHEAAPILDGVAGREVVAIVCTHAHNDHITAAADVRAAVTRNGGSMADPGSVSYNFNRKGVVTVPAAGTDEDAILEATLDAGAQQLEEIGVAVGSRDPQIRLLFLAGQWRATAQVHAVAFGAGGAGNIMHQFVLLAGIGRPGIALLCDFLLRRLPNTGLDFLHDMRLEAWFRTHLAFRLLHTQEGDQCIAVGARQFREEVRRHSP